jgi:hypothetical protein
VGVLAWLVHNTNPEKCLSKLINWASKSSKTFGHAFLKHGEKNLKKLTEIARQKKIPQGM